MATIRQHRPAYFTGYENQTVEFNSLEELLKIEFVDNFKKTFNKPLPVIEGVSVSPHLMDYGQDNDGFHQFSISESNGKKLMAEYRKGKEWWVVGYITDEKGITNTLPKWEPK